MCIYLVVDVNSRLVISSAISHIMCFKLNVCLLVGYFTQFIHITSYQERFATAEDIVWWRDKNEKIGSWDHKAWITKGPKWKVRLRISWLQYLHRWPTERACCVQLFLQPLQHSCQSEDFGVHEAGLSGTHCRPIKSHNVCYDAVPCRMCEEYVVRRIIS